MIRPLPGALFTDLYELAMAQAYRAEGMHGTAVFELFFRRLPPGRNYVLAAGLDGVLSWLEALRFEEDEVEWLRSLGRFDEALLQHLRGLRFTGDVWAVPEGTPVFGNEPIVQVVAPIVEAQLVETWLINHVHLQSVLATKAARVVEAAAGRDVVDFGARRAHGADAADALARCAWIAGAAGTSNVEAGRRHGIPVVGTMAHSFVQAHESEARAFEIFARLQPGATLLVDTWDTLAGVDRVIELLRREPRLHVGGIRLDSGDLGALASEARRRLDEAGCTSVRIVASSDLDEWSIARLVEAGAPIDVFGVGTRMGVSPDAPTLDMVYKLVEYDGVGRCKLSPGKVLHPGRKQVFRTERGDTVGAAGEALEGEPLLEQVMRGGVRVGAGTASLQAIRARAAATRARLPEAIRALAPAPTPWPVAFSPGLEAALQALRPG